MTVFLKQLLPWNFYVAFIIFFIGDQLTSVSALIADVPKAFGANIDYLTMILVNIPMLIRMGQCAKRYKETKKAYPHIVNLFKYLSSFPCTFANLNVVKANTKALLAI